MPNFSLRRYGPKKFWYVFYTEDGRSFRRSTGTSSHAEAKAFRDDFAREKLTPANASQNEISVASVLQRYFDEHRRPWPAWKNARTCIKMFSEFYGTDPVSAITPASCALWEKMRLADGIAASTINNQRVTLVAALNHAHKHGRLTSVPHVSRMPPTNPKLRYLTRQEAADLLRACRKSRVAYLTLFVRIALYTGARHRAVLQLTWDRVDLKDGWLDFNVPGVEVTKKRRPVAPINFKLARALRAARPTGSNSQRHVIGSKPEPMSAVWVAFRSACKRAKLKDVTPHTLKHTMITWGLAKASPWDVSGVTATSLATLTTIYGKHMKGHLKQAVAAMATK
jgi:integrase